MSEGIPRKISRLSLPDLPSPPTDQGNVCVCGQGEVGQLGLGEDIMERKRPALVKDMPKTIAIAAGGMHNVCITVDQDVYSFGCNDEGALGRDTSEEGSEFVPKKVDLPSKAVKISAGDSHSAALLDDGRVFVWGSFRNSHGSMGLTLEGGIKKPIELLPEHRFVDIASGADHLVLLTTKAKMYTVGCAEQGQLGRVSLRSASGEGRRGNTDLLTPDVLKFPKANNIDAVWATTYCTLLRDRKSQNIYAFGLNNYKQLGIPKLETVFRPELTPFKNVKKITGGQHHTLVLSNDNKVFAIGRGDYGRLGLGESVKESDTLTLIEKLASKNVVDIACGESCSFAVTDKGELYSWGIGSNQQLGTGSEDDVYEPTHIVSEQLKQNKVMKVSSGGQHSIFLVAPEGDENSKKSNTKASKPKENGTTENKVEDGAKKTTGNGRKRKAVD